MPSNPLTLVQGTRFFCCVHSRLRHVAIKESSAPESDDSSHSHQSDSHRLTAPRESDLLVLNLIEIGHERKKDRKKRKAGKPFLLM